MPSFGVAHQRHCFQWSNIKRTCLRTCPAILHAKNAICHYIASAGFIDFIVAPTMNVLGDVLEAIFRSLEAANQTPGSGPPSSDKAAKKLNRPWADQLGVNKAKWAAKNEAGACACDVQSSGIFSLKHESSLFRSFI